MSSLIKCSGLSGILIGICLLVPAQERGAEWTHFRGPELDGISPEALPVTWNDSTHIAWRSAIPGRGWSSPVVFGEQVWLTTALVEENRLMAVCLDLQTGALVHSATVFTPDTFYRKHSVNTYATPTPAIEEGRIYVHFGRYGTACLDTRTGKKVWERNDLQCNHVQGPGSSVVLHKDKLIVHMEGTDVQFIAALDKHNGRTLWRTDRPKELYDPLEEIGKKAYVTPLVVELNGRDILISNGSAVCIAYDAETGKEIWRIVQGEDSTIAMPVAHNGWVFFYTSFVTGEDGKKTAELLAVDPDGRGNIGNSHIKWRLSSPILQLLTPVAVDGLLYTVNSQSYLQCIDARNGEVKWEKRLKGKFHSSPLYAEGLLYVNSTRGETFVCRAGNSYDEVAVNRLRGEIWATPAVARGSIVMRTSEYVYRITGPETASRPLPAESQTRRTDAAGIPCP